MKKFFHFVGDESAQVYDHKQMLHFAIDEAKAALAEGEIPIGAALFDDTGHLISTGHSRMNQSRDNTAHAIIDAIKKAGPRESYRNIIVVSSLAPCHYCSGFIRQYNIPKVIIGDTLNLTGGIEWLRENAIEVIDMNAQQCIEMIGAYIKNNKEIWEIHKGIKH